MKQFCPAGHDTFVTGRYSSSSCKACVKARDAARYQADSEAAKARTRASAKANPVATRLRQRQKKGIIGLPAVEAKPGHPCDCCGRPIVGTPQAEHDHGTRLFRGWTCKRCNIRLGARDDAVWMKQADTYLSRPHP